MKINIGILGATEVAKRVIINPLKELKNLSIYGIASRDYQKAKSFSEALNIPHVFKSYDELISDKNIDLVYIPLATNLHSKWVINALEQNKRVFVEKPICLTSSEIKLIKNTLKNNSNFLYESCMAQHHPWQNYITEVIENNVYGKLLYLETEFAYPFPDYYINSYAEKGGGIFIHDAIYWLQMVQKCLGLNPVTFDAHSAFDGLNNIELSLNARLDYSGNVYSSFSCTWRSSFKACHEFKFEKAILRIDNFLRSSFGRNKFNIKIFDLENKLVDTKVFHPENEFVNQLIFISEAIVNKNNCLELLEQSFERVVMMEKIYNVAKSNLALLENKLS